MDLQKLMQTGEGVEDLEKNLLNLDSEFRFKCRRCGKCCQHQDTIIFNTRDIFNIARELNMTMQGVVEAFTEVYIGNNSRIPIVHLLSDGPGESCPLLKDGRCSVHAHKPTVCALFPLGRVVINKKHDSPALTPGTELEVRYILNDIGDNCGSAARVNTVRSWLARFGIPENDAFFMLWNKVIIDLGDLVRMLESKEVSEYLLSTIETVIFNILYLQYDTGMELMPQFQAAADKLLKLSAATRGSYLLTEETEEGVVDGDIRDN